MKLQKIVAILACLLCWPARSVSADELRVMDTVHYRIHTDLDPPLASDLAQRLDMMYDQYAARLADFSLHSNRKFEVYLFEHRSTYRACTRDVLPNTGGMFIASRRMLAAFLEGQGRDTLRRVLQHEAFHQFAYEAFGPRLPIWLNEGIAQVFEEGIWTGRELLLGQVPPRRLRQLAADTAGGRFLPFGQFINLDDATWSHDMADMETGAARYDQAWAMTHFLIFATEGEARPKYRQRLINMLQDIRAGQAGIGPFTANFSTNFDGFQQHFSWFAATLGPTPAAVYLEHQSVLADLLIALQSRGGATSIEDFQRKLMAGQMRLQYTKGAMQWNSGEPAIYFRDLSGQPLDRSQLYFSTRPDAPLPDMVCHPPGGLELVTIFHASTGKPESETVIRSP